MTPLFVAAGSLMAPTVIAGGFATWPNDWRRGTRALWACIATAPAAFVGHDMVAKHGVSLRALGGILAMVTIYTAVVAGTGFTIAPQHDGWQLPRSSELLLRDEGVVAGNEPVVAEVAHHRFLTSARLVGHRTPGAEPAP